MMLIPSLIDTTGSAALRSERADFLFLVPLPLRTAMAKLDVLTSMTFGRRVAEEEGDELTKYFVETDFWKRLYAGEIDIVYGPKGSGKSALYALLLARRSELFDRSIILAPAENPRGAPAFRDLATDPPATEFEFTSLWKLYFASLISDVLDEFEVTEPGARKLREALEAESLVRRGRSLSGLLRAAVEYVRTFTRKPEAVEAGIEFDPIIGTPSGVKGKIIFREPSATDLAAGRVSIDQLLEGADEALTAVETKIWILLDRLDVAFAETPDLEENALRALFRVYLDLLRFDHIALKIFLRTDIWRRITRAGFREASHVTRFVTITWNRRNLLYLVVLRAISNRSVQQFYDLTPQDALQSPEAQEAFYYRMTPRQVDVGPNKPNTFDWVLGRTRDGTGQTAPRELIHLHNSLREEQVRRLEIADPDPEGEELFVRAAFKEALAEVSRTRLEQTLFAEYPGLRVFLEALRGEKTAHTIATLARIWKMSEAEAGHSAAQLVEIGFFEQRGSRELPVFWVPFLYRDGLELVQGSAEVEAAGPVSLGQYELDPLLKDDSEGDLFQGSDKLG